MTSSAGKSGLMRFGLPPIFFIASRMVAKSTTAGTPVKSCRSTRAGMNLSRAARARALLNGRNYCIADDIHGLAVPVFAHRVRLAAHAEGYAPTREETEAAIREVIARVPVPL